MPPKPSKVLTRADVKAQTNDKKVLVIIKDNIYDVTDFLDEHPGGHRGHQRSDHPEHDFPIGIDVQQAGRRERRRDARHRHPPRWFHLRQTARASW